MNELFNVNQRLHNFLTKQKEAGGNTTDENRSIGTQATLNNKDVYWSGQNYGWQSQDSYNKLKEGPEFRAGHINATRIGTDVNQAIGMGVDALPEQVKSTALDVVRQGVQLYQGLPQGIRTGINNVGQGLSNANELVSKTTNISPIITGEALTAAGTAGTGTLAKKGANVASRQIIKNLPVDDVAHALTVSPKFRAPGVTEGIAQLPTNVKAREILNKSLARLDKRRTRLNEQVASGEIIEGDKEYLRFDKKIREERYGEMSSFYNNLDHDPPTYGRSKYKNTDPINEAKMLEQHHLAGKAQTQPFIEKIMEVGDTDDLVALHEYSRMLGVFMGNGKLNMLDAPGPIHRAAVARTVEEKAGNIHSAFNKAGLEKDNAFVKNLLKDATTSDEVMEVFTQYAKEQFIPQQNIAKKIVDKYLKEYEINLNPSQKARFIDLASKANKGA